MAVQEKMVATTTHEAVHARESRTSPYRDCAAHGAQHDQLQVEQEMGNKKPRILIVGVGNCGINVVNRMIINGLKGYEVVVIGTDPFALQRSLAPIKLHVRRKLRGLDSYHAKISYFFSMLQGKQKWGRTRFSNDKYRV